MRKFLDIMNGITPPAEASGGAFDAAPLSNGNGMRRLDEGVFSFMRSLVGKRDPDAEQLSRRVQATREPPPAARPAAQASMPAPMPRSHSIGGNVVQPTSQQWTAAKDLMGKLRNTSDATHQASIRGDLKHIARDVPRTVLADRISLVLNAKKDR